MTILNFARVNEGDWISGTTPVDEKFIGFVESMYEAGVVEVLVTQSDREAIVGTTIRAKLTKVKKLSEPTPISPEEVRSLIELALGTHDKEWFEQLSVTLTQLSATGTGTGTRTGTRTATDLNGTYTLTQLKERF